jgi:ribonuclease HII
VLQTDLPATRRLIPPTLEQERAFWRAGLPLVAGVDEVGRGALAGPLVAATVILPAVTGTGLRQLRAALAGVRDSKLLSHAQRCRAVEGVTQQAVATAIGIVPSEELDEIGLAAANRVAMERAVLGLAASPDALLLDACVIDLGMPQVGLIRGDARSLSIAAASILAKVTRDAIMTGCEDEHPVYGFAVHKGYGTRDHLAALRHHGPCALHRRSFALGLDPAAALKVIPNAD